MDARLLFSQGLFYAPNPGPPWFLFWLFIFSAAFALAARDRDVGALHPSVVLVTPAASTSAQAQGHDIPLLPSMDAAASEIAHLMPSTDLSKHGAAAADTFPSPVPRLPRPPYWLLAAAGAVLGLLQAVQMCWLPMFIMMPIAWGSLPFDVAFFIAGLAGK
jgi:hypothetical protein